MKKVSIIISAGLSIFLFAQAACNHTATQKKDMNKDTTPSTFSTADEAAMQARQDMLNILRSDKGISMGISDTAALMQASPGKAVKQFSIDFDKLLTADSVTTISSLALEEQNTIIPLVNNKRPVTVIELSQHENKWSIASLAGKALTDDLNTVISAVDNDTSFANERQITLYEVPNLNAKLFLVSSGNNELVFTNYNSFSLRQGISAASLIPILKESAIRFQHEFGDLVKKQKLAE